MCVDRCCVMLLLKLEISLSFFFFFFEDFWLLPQFDRVCRDRKCREREGSDMQCRSPGEVSNCGRCGNMVCSLTTRAPRLEFCLFLCV